LVEHGVVRLEQVEHTAIFTQNAVHEQLGLEAEGLTKVVGEIRVQAHVRIDGRQVAQPEPLSGEVTREIVRARIGEHPAGLSLEYVRLAQLASNGRIEEFVIGDTAPEKE